MSSLTDRLRGIVRGSAPSGAVFTEERPHPTSLESAADVLGGRWDEATKCFLVERRVEASFRHGAVSVGAVSDDLNRAADHTAILATTRSPARPPFVFFDLETTGLSGGAGTCAFLVGLGWFAADGAFETRQYVLLEYSSERAMLQEVARELGQAGALVSYNGKSFDAPVLETRYLFHRLEWVGEGLPHVDMLHPARRFWRRGDADGLDAGCSLSALEHEWLGVRRIGDVPGFEIPARYFQFVRTGSARPLTGVLEHNRLDLLSLAAVTARLLGLVADGAASAANAWEALALGRTFLRGGMEGPARGAFERALEMSERCGSGNAERGATIDALRMLALMSGRGRRFDEAAEYWRQALNMPTCPAYVVREANRALAVHHEHRVRDLAAAKTFALRSLVSGSRTSWDDAVRHRLQRLERKLSTGQPRLPSLPFPFRPSSGSPTSAPRTSS